jgi:alkylation response protein AidB-like acyl-CoA dehydrogenase
VKGYGQSIYGHKYFEYARFFRKIALEIENNPESIMQYKSHPAIQELVMDQTSTCLERVQRLEALCYGDAGVMLACPGPSLSGLIIREIGDEEQKQYFFDFVQSTSARTLFALTEPDFGSEAGHIQSRIKPKTVDTFELSCKKCLFGNGAAASIGVVLVKASEGPLGMRAILLTPDHLNEVNKITRKKLNCFALIGAQLSYLECENLEIDSKNILGMHLNPLRSGMMAIITTFNQMRPGVAAIALGHAQAVWDYLYSHANNRKRLQQIEMDGLLSQLKSIRQYLHQTANQVDKSPRVQVYSSMAKQMATLIAEKISQTAIKYFGLSLFIDHPILAKWIRDVYAYEYMEGTTYVQLQNIFNHYKTSVAQGGY